MEAPQHPRRAGAIDALRDALGPDVVRRPADFADRRFADSSRMPCAQPAALLLPRGTDQVALALRICHAHRQPVVTQGGLSGLAGGACLLGGEVALSLERMSAVEAIDPASATMTVQAGTPLQRAQEAAADAGWQLALDLGARGSCTIGGNLATNAGGNRVIRYGMMRDQVLDLEAVLADGSVIGGSRAMIKNNTGYDLRHLLVGSEGTLAVITRAVLRLRPKPRAVFTAFCGLADPQALTTLLGQAQARLPSGVSAFEVMWPGYYDFALARVPALRRPLADRHGAYVLLESMAADPVREGESFEEFLGAMLEAGTIADAAFAASESDALAFWAIREVPAEYQRLLPGRTSFDVKRIETELRALRPAATVLVYGHLGDGNLHVVVHEPDWPAAVVEAVKARVYGLTGELGGSVSAEHGIGTKKLGVLGLTRSPAEIAAMRAIKSALDPLGLLNPGKVLAPAG